LVFKRVQPTDLPARSNKKTRRRFSRRDFGAPWSGSGQEQHLAPTAARVLPLRESNSEEEAFGPFPVRAALMK